jgi:hypothetical protein
MQQELMNSISVLGRQSDSKITILSSFEVNKLNWQFVYAASLVLNARMNKEIPGTWATTLPVLVSPLVFVCRS